MPAEPIPSQPARREAPDLKIESLRLSYENTLLAFVRTAIALIGFGFTIAKFFESLESRPGPAPLIQPRTIGLTMVGLGILALVLGTLHLRQGQRRFFPDTPRSPATNLAITIAALGTLAFIAVLVRS